MHYRTRLKTAILESRYHKQRGVARKAEMAESRLSDIINGWVTPRPDERAALARVLDRPAEELFEDEAPVTAA